jgi:hypothetical protein
MSKRYRTTNLAAEAPRGTSFYTMYVVRDADRREFLAERAYSGTTAQWDTLPNAVLFATPEGAGSCASNINARSPGLREAGVRPVLVARKAV